jgi:hypothetical protein
MDAVSVSGSGTAADPWVGWDDYLTTLSTAGKENVHAFFPSGHYLLSQLVDFKYGWTWEGEGMRDSWITTPDNYTGSAVRMTGPLDGATYGLNRISDLTIECANQSSTGVGTGIEHVALQYLYLDRVQVLNWKYGLVLNQTEFGFMDECLIQNSGPWAEGTIGTWLVNLPDHTGFTNAVFFNRCSWNAYGDTYPHVVDGAGVCRTLATDAGSGADWLRVLSEAATARSLDSIGCCSRRRHGGRNRRKGRCDHETRRHG